MKMILEKLTNTELFVVGLLTGILIIIVIYILFQIINPFYQKISFYYENKESIEFVEKQGMKEWRKKEYY